MLDWRSRHQTAVALILFVAVLIATLLIWSKFLRAVPSCTDSIRNQGETEVDCGGSCIPCELKHPKPMSVFWARAVAVRPLAYDAIAYMQNTNESLSSGRIEYEFSLYDSKGFLTARKGSTFVFAQERFYVIEPNIQASAEPTRVEFRVLNTEWQLRTETKPNLIMERRNYLVAELLGKKMSIVEAVVFNSAPYDFREVELHVVVFDGEGNVLGGNSAIIERLVSGTRRTVRLTWPEELKGEIRTVSVEARANIFDPSTIITPQ